MNKTISIILGIPALFLGIFLLMIGVVEKELFPTVLGAYNIFCGTLLLIFYIINKD